MGLLDGHRAIVTGGASGIGAATCRRMTEEGARVAVVDINGDAAEQEAKEIDGLAYAVDVTDYDALSASVDDAAAKLDGLTPCSTTRGRATSRRCTTGPSRNGIASSASIWEASFTASRQPPRTC
jgi:NAD(P)-dependent dehydrogenase (short-subunit alcohol dehydrogenase family)